MTDLALLPPAGSHVAVLGACGGIGADIVRSLIEGGCTVIAMDLPGSLAKPPLPRSTASRSTGATNSPSPPPLRRFRPSPPSLTGW